MSTFNLRKVLHLIEPDQPVEYWEVGMVDYLGKPIWIYRTLVIKTVAKNVGLVNKPLTRGCDQNNPVFLVKTFGFGSNAILTVSAEKISKIPVLPMDQFYTEFSKLLKETISFEKELLVSINNLLS